MGLKNEKSPRTYVKLTKEGKFALASNLEDAYDTLEGTVVDMYLKDDTWEGQDIRKLYVVLQSGDDLNVLNFTFDSSYMSTFLNFLKNADLSKPIALSTKIENIVKDGVTKVKRVMFVKQDGTALKSFYNKENDQVPRMEEKVINKKKIWVKDEYLQFYEDLVNDFKNKLKGASTPSVFISKKDIPSSPNNAAAAPDAEVVDDLPF